MISRPQPPQDERDAARVLDQVLARRPAFTPEWLAEEKSAGRALAAIFSRYLEAVIKRRNQAPAKNKLAFLDLAGLGLTPAQAARAPLVFQLSEKAAAGGTAPAGTAVAAPPPPGGTQQISFETERAAGITSGKIRQVVSLWPGRDEYIDHSAAFLAGEPVLPFARTLRQPTPHQLYLRHATLLALAGNVRLDVEFELSHPAAAPLDLIWQYWDGKVWRGFLTGEETVGNEDQENTNGLTRSGSYQLKADCAQAVKVAVNGIEGFWLRGQLTQPLPADPEKALPEVERVRISSTVDRALTGTLRPSEPYAPQAVVALLVSDFSFIPAPVAVPVPFAAMASTGFSISGRVLNEASQPIEGATVLLSGAFGEIESGATQGDGAYTFANVPFSASYQYRVRLAGLEFGGPQGVGVSPKEPPSPFKPIVDLTVVVDGLRVEKAFADGTALDVSKPFYPLGQQTQPGSTFYFKNDEVFDKPNATVRVYMARTKSPQDEAADQGTSVDHVVAWEYWNGRTWAPIAISSKMVSPRFDLNVTEVVDFKVPIDIQPLKVNDEDGRWLRVRLQSGAYGKRRTVSFQTGTGAGAATNSFTYVTPAPPVLADLRIGYTWQYGPFAPEQVLTYNDFQYEDHTYEATWPGASFRPFQRVADVTPALYLGFDKKPPENQIGIYFNVVEQPGEPNGPALQWEYWDGAQWRETASEDETGNLRRPGIVAVLTQENDHALARFGTALHWIRGRLKEDGPPGEPEIKGIFPNAVWASERRTVRDVPVGTSNGTPNQTFPLTQTPINAGERIEVREFSGARAAVEWRIVALELFAGDQGILKDLEQALGREGSEPDVVRDPLRLRRNRQKQVSEVWVRWDSRDQLFFSGPQDRVYSVDRAQGRLYFGDGLNGRIPPAGGAIVARELSSGGGSFGNVAANSIKQLLGVVPGIEAVFNPVAAEGGADGEMPEALLERGPHTVRHRGRAIAGEDYETLAYQASPALAIARALPNRNASGRKLPGWISVLIVPHSKDPRPFPSFGLREHVRKYLERYAPAEVGAYGRLLVIGPQYMPVDVSATIAPKLASEAGNVDQRAREALETFLHPLFGGPRGEGWDLGRDVFLSDVAAALHRVEGLDYAEDLALLRDGVPAGESIEVPDDRIVAAGTITLTLKGGEK